MHNQKTYITLITCALLVSACSSNKETSTREQEHGPPSAAQAPVTAQQAPRAEPEQAAAPSADLEVEEWGLVLYSPRGAKARSGKVTRSLPPKAPARKPVIYLKPSAGPSPDTTISVKVEFAGSGKLHEVWPTPKGGPQPEHQQSFSWTPIKIKDGPCAPGWAPAPDDVACTSLTHPDDCESAQMSSWILKVERCLEVDGISTPALLYNGYPADTSAPLTRTEQGTWRNDTKHPLGPLLIRERGELMCIERVEAGQEAKAEPAAAVNISQWTLEQLRSQGLGEQESQDFIRAWRGDLNNPLSWIAFGVFEAQAIEDICTLEITPKPSKITRTLAFMVTN
jgi:hypothetical protein